MSGNQFSIRLTIDFKTSKPWALKKLLKHIRVKYKNPAVMIHENGNLARILSRISLTRNEQHFAADAHHMKSIESYCAFFLFISGAADRPDPSGGNRYDDEFRSQFLQDYIKATLQSIRYQ
jgi:beta-glucosidase